MSRLLDVRLPVSLLAPGIARREVRRITSELEQELQESLALLVSELVSNSVRHARHTTSFIQLKTWVIGTAVRVCVGDSGPGFSPTVIPPGPEAEGRRGLWLIDMLADTWGISVDGATWSWFEIHGASAGTRAGRELERFLEAIAAWPLRSRDLAWSMGASLGLPAGIVPNRLTWTTPQCIATILCPGQHPARGPRGRRHGLIEDRNGRWWLETLRNHPHHPSVAGNSTPRTTQERPAGSIGEPAHQS